MGGNEGDRRLLHKPLNRWWGFGTWMGRLEQGGGGNHVFSLSLVNLRHFGMVLVMGN